MFDLPWSMIYVAVLFIMHPLLGWAAMIFTAFLGIVAWFNHHISTACIDNAAEREMAAHSWLASKLRNAEVVEAMGMLANFRNLWNARQRELIKAQTLAQRRQVFTSAIAKFIQYLQQALILSIGAWLVIRGQLSIGAMIASNLLMGNALRPIASLVKTWKEYVHARHAAHEVAHMLSKYAAAPSNHFSNKIDGEISLYKLSAFRPASGSLQPEPILRELDIEFSAGEVIAIVGHTGAGKSTLLRCLLGIWPDTRGSVKLDGIDIRDWSREPLGERIGYLPQDIELFDGTIAENICRFQIKDRTLDSEAIIEAAKQADIHSMILRLPQGYDTPIGVAGQILSAGQRQRLALARALYGAPDIVVLDEPNANLDDAGELALGNAIRSLRARGKTVFMVLHQRSLLTLADRVLAMSDGRITAYGKIDAPAAEQTHAQSVPPTEAPQVNTH